MKTHQLPEAPESAQPYVIHEDEGQSVWFASTRLTVKASSPSTGGSLTLIHATVAPGFASPLHVHHREDEAFYVLDGSVRYVCGDETFDAGARSFVFLPRDIPHAYKVVGDRPARWLLLGAPSGMEGYFIEGGTPALDGGISPQTIDPQKMAAVGARYGVETLGPPPF
jgi:quercetin dioxygenase-like cupin family protein